MASFPSATVSKPSGIAAGNSIITAHVDTAWDEVIALEAVLRGGTTLATTGTNLNIKSGATGAVPLVLQGFAGQTADILSIGTSAGTADLFRFKPDGKLHLVGTTNAAGLQLGSSTVSNIWSTGTDVLVRPSTDGTGAVKLRNAADSGSVWRADTTNLRLGIGSDTAPSATLHLAAASTPTTAAFGIQFGSDATNLYRSAATTLKTDGDFSVGANLVFNDVSLSRTAANVLTLATGDSLRLPGTNAVLLVGEDTAVSQLQVTRSASARLVDYWFLTNTLGGETSSRYRIDAAGKHVWTDGSNPGTPVSLSVIAANAGLSTNLQFDVGGTLTVTGAATLAGGSVVGANGISWSGGGVPKIKRGATDSGYSGTDVLTVYAKDTVFHTTASNTPTRLGLKRPDGIIRYMRLDNDDQIIIEAS